MFTVEEMVMIGRKFHNLQAQAELYEQICDLAHQVGDDVGEMVWGERAEGLRIAIKLMSSPALLPLVGEDIKKF